MTQNPCYKNGTDCHRRYVGCKAECEEWHEWLAIHERELEQIRSKRNENHEYYEYSGRLMDKQDRHKSRKRRGQL
jgi:hypothetical protein